MVRETNGSYIHLSTGLHSVGIILRASRQCGIEVGDPPTGPPSHWSPISLVPFSLVPQLIGPQYIIGAHWSPISLVPHITGPPSHWSPFSFVTPSSANPNGPPSHWSPISLVPQSSPDYAVLIGPPVQPFLPYFRWSLISLAPAQNKYLTSRSRLSIWSTHPVLSIGSCLEKKVTYTDLLHYPGSKKLKKSIV